MVKSQNNKNHDYESKNAHSKRRSQRSKRKEVKSQSLQAIVLADYEEENFTPLTLITPKFLIPVANVPAIEYTFEFLLNAGVNEIFLVTCSKYSETYKRYLSTSGWIVDKLFTNVQIVLVDNSFGACDSLRRISQMHLVTSDPFVLVSSIIVSTFDLKKAILFQKALYNEDKHNFITCVMKEIKFFSDSSVSRLGTTSLVTCEIDDTNTAGDSRPTRTSLSKSLTQVLVKEPSHSSQALLTTSSKTNENSIDFSLCRQILQHSCGEVIQKLILEGHGQREIVASSSVFLSQNVDDCMVDVCSLGVLSMCVDNFDFRDLRGHLLKSALESELEGLRAYAYFVSEDYIGAVKDLKSFDSVSKDVLNYWAYPICPLTNLFCDSNEAFDSCFKHVSSSISALSDIEKSSLVGKDVSIGDRTKIISSVIGEGCKIGDNCRIVNSYLLPNCVIKNNVSIDFSLLGFNAFVEQFCSLLPGSALGDFTKLEKNTKVESFKVLTESGEFDFCEFKNENRFNKSHFVTRSFAPDYLIATFNEDLVCPVKIESINKINEKSEFDKMRKQINSYYRDVSEIIKNAETNGNSVEMTGIEVTSLRLSSHISDLKIILIGIIKALFSCVRPLPKTGSTESSLKKETLVSLENILYKWSNLFSKALVNESDQRVLILALEEVCVADSSPFFSLFPHCLNILYDMEFLSEETLMDWWKEKKEATDNSDRVNMLLTASKVFIEWLQEANEESE